MLSIICAYLLNNSKVGGIFYMDDFGYCNKFVFMLVNYIEKDISN